MTHFIKHWIEELELDLTHELENKSETNYNGLAIATCERRLEIARDAQHLLATGEVTIIEAENMVAEALSI